MATSTSGLTIDRHFTMANTHPFDEVAWEVRDAVIVGKDGQPVFEARGVEFPSFWSQRATDIVASKYFRIVDGKRETSVKELLTRVARSITVWGMLDGYFEEGSGETFRQELTHLLLHQYAAFNSPVWFNVGVQERPTTSACFILYVEDDMGSILEWVRQEGMIFKAGSGAGVNLSKLRANGSPLSSGGKASGPVSFMRLADAGAGVIKSAGSTRRAAKMVILDVEHPDIEEFIWCKASAEEMAEKLRAAGYSDGLEGEIQQAIPFQNANNSVSVDDAFMHLVSTDVASVGAHTARLLLGEIASAAWRSGDPGLFFRDTVNKWHTTPGRGPIVSSNPCSEFLQPPNSSCNLASLNLLKFLHDDGSFDIAGFQHAVRILITAMDILIDRSSYPTPEIEKNSHDYRPLGLGYANLGALLMAKGLPYDSDEGRALAASLTALMTGEAYAQSARLAEVKGAFAGFDANRGDMTSVIMEHAASLAGEFWGKNPQPYGYGIDEIIDAANSVWRLADEPQNFRNCQMSLLAPTGTISFMMDCDTTGIEPCIGLVSTKKLVGGGEVTMVNGTVECAMRALGYDEDTVVSQMQHLREHGAFLGNMLPAAWYNEKHARVFDTALGDNPISWQAHIAMVAAVQPFLSSGVSKTINMPAESTIEDIEQAFILAWKSGLKSIAVYRDGCKSVQPVTVEKRDNSAAVKALDEWYSTPPTEGVGLGLAYTENGCVPTPIAVSPRRRRLPNDRTGFTHKLSVAGHECYLTVNTYDDGKPGELFIRMAKEGSTIGGLMDAFGTMVSIALQYGVPLSVMTDKFIGSRFEPSGPTINPVIPVAKSLIDYIFTWLKGKFEEKVVFAIDPGREPFSAVAMRETGQVVHTHAPLCTECGGLCRPNGACWLCESCGSSTGCS